MARHSKGPQTAADLEKEAAKALAQAKRIKAMEAAEREIIPLLRKEAEKGFEGTNSTELVEKIKVVYEKKLARTATKATDVST